MFSTTQSIWSHECLQEHTYITNHCVLRTVLFGCLTSIIKYKNIHIITDPASWICSLGRQSQFLWDTPDVQPFSNEKTESGGFECRYSLYHRRKSRRIRWRPLRNSGTCNVQLAIGSDADPDISIRGGTFFFVIQTFP